MTTNDFTLPDFPGITFRIDTQKLTLKAMETDFGPDGQRSQAIRLPEGVEMKGPTLRSQCFVAARKLQQILTK